ncbi:MAG TPA: hypothetical protein DDY91_11170 [Planctomycetaceae bacterium]|nr:hypothetical protein [Planctomycetaceae bacterium]
MEGSSESRLCLWGTAVGPGHSAGRLDLVTREVPVWPCLGIRSVLVRWIRGSACLYRRFLSAANGLGRGRADCQGGKERRPSLPGRRTTAKGLVDRLPADYS